MVVRDDDNPPAFLIEKMVEKRSNGRRGISASFPTVRGFRYLLESASSPGAADWTVLLITDGNNSSQTFWDSTDESVSRVYRFRVENEIRTVPGD